MKRRMFYTLLAVFVFLAAAGPLCAAGNAVSYKNGEQERFRLFNAEYNSAFIQTSQTTKFMEKRLFKIDQKTGDTWMLIDVFRDGKDSKYWKKIENEQVGGME